MENKNYKIILNFTYGKHQLEFHVRCNETEFIEEEGLYSWWYCLEPNVLEFEVCFKLGENGLPRLETLYINAFEHGAYEEGLLYVKKYQATLKVDDKVVETFEKK